MKVFFETEFTALHKNTTLISIGLVDENGRTFYAEFSDYDESQCDEWLHENVIKHLRLDTYEHYGFHNNNTEAYGNKKFIKEKLSDWFSKYEEVELISDCCHYNMVLFTDIFGCAFDLPENVNPVCHDINQDIAKYYNKSEKEALNLSREEIIEYSNIKLEGDKYNSLYDAKVIKEIYKIVN